MKAKKLEASLPMDWILLKVISYALTSFKTIFSHIHKCDLALEVYRCKEHGWAKVT